MGRHDASASANRPSSHPASMPPATTVNESKQPRQPRAAHKLPTSCQLRKRLGHGGHYAPPSSARNLAARSSGDAPRTSAGSNSTFSTTLIVLWLSSQLSTIDFSSCASTFGRACHNATMGGKTVSARTARLAHSPGRAHLQCARSSACGRAPPTP